MILILSLFVVVIVGAALASALLLRLKSLSSKSCSALIEGMHYVDLRKVCAVARNKEEPYKDSQQRVKFEIEQLGGVDGLLRLHHNAGAMMNIARYLILMSPEAYDLGQDIRRDAAKVRRTAKLLYWRHRFHMDLFEQPKSVRAFARHYISISVNTMVLCDRFVDEVMPLMQVVSHVQAEMSKTLFTS